MSLDKLDTEVGDLDNTAILSVYPCYPCRADGWGIERGQFFIPCLPAFIGNEALSLINEAPSLVNGVPEPH